MEIPKWAKISELQISGIENAIARAESKTSGEIVPMIVRRSSTIGHVPMLVIAFLVILFLVFDGFELQAKYLSPHWGMWILDFIVVLGLARILASQHWVQRLLTADADEVTQVNLRCEIEFYEAGLNLTRDSTGILLFVSLMEHRAVVLADKAISSKLPPETWKDMVGLLIDGSKKGNFEEGFSKAIDKCGLILAEHFPIKPDDTNELHDHLIIKE